MTSSEELLDELDAVLEESLPDDIENELQTREHESAEDSSDFRKQVARATVGEEVPDSEYDQVLQNEIQSLSTELDVPPEVQSLANRLATQFADAASMSGRVFELYAAAILYCACKLNETPVVPAEVANTGGDLLTRKRLLRRVKIVANEVGLDPSAFFEASQYVDRYTDELGCSDNVQDRAEWIIDTLKDTGLASGKSPSGWAAAAIYNAALDCNCKITQHEIATVANVTEVTIRSRYQEQRDAYKDDGC